MENVNVFPEVLIPIPLPEVSPTAPVKVFRLATGVIVFEITNVFPEFVILILLPAENPTTPTNFVELPFNESAVKPAYVLAIVKVLPDCEMFMLFPPVRYTEPHRPLIPYTTPEAEIPFVDIKVPEIFPQTN